MALQGTIDILPLADVLQLLASSSRTGRLVLDGDRGRAMVAVHEGLVAGGDLDGTPLSPIDLVVAALRFADGSFVFDVDELVLPEDARPRPVAELLEEAAGVLAEWEAVLAVVPSPQHRVGPVPAIEDEVVLGPEDWGTVLASTDVPSLQELGARLGLGELAAGRRAVELVGRGLLEVHEPSLPAEQGSDRRSTEPDVAADPGDGRGSGAHVAPAPFEVLDAPVDTPFPDHFPIDDLVAEDDGASEAWSDELQDGQAPAAPSSTFADGGWADGDWGDRHSEWDALVDDTEGADAAGVPDFGDVADEPVWDAAPSWSEVDGAADPAVAAFTPAPAVQPSAAFHDVAPAVSPFVSGEAPGFPADRSVTDHTTPDQIAPGHTVPGAGSAEDGTDEVLRQMARLSPKAAEAIAAALGTVGDGPSDGAVAEDGFLRPG